MLSSHLVRRRTSTLAAGAVVESPVALQFASPTDAIPKTTHKYNKHSHEGTIDSAGWPHKILFAGGVFLAILPWALHLLTVLQGHALQRTIESATNEYRILQQQFATRKKGLQKTMAETSALQDSNEKLLAQLKLAGDTFEDFENEAYAESEKLEKDLLQRIDDVEKEISHASERNLKERGCLFHRNTVEIRILGMGDIDKHLVMEFAPTTIVPHVVDTFISFVESNYYNGWSLLHRGIVGQQTLEAVRRDVQQLQGLSVVSAHNSDMQNQLALLQHSDELLNVKYSVVFKDHGPFFYINMDGSTVSHNHNDVVIGTIVEGREILDFLVQHHLFVAIEKMEFRSIDPMALTTEPRQNGSNEQPRQRHDS